MMKGKVATSNFYIQIDTELNEVNVRYTTSSLVDSLTHLRGFWGHIANQNYVSVHAGKGVLNATHPPYRFPERPLLNVCTNV